MSLAARFVCYLCRSYTVTEQAANLTTASVKVKPLKHASSMSPQVSSLSNNREWLSLEENHAEGEQYDGGDRRNPTPAPVLLH